MTKLSLCAVGDMLVQKRLPGAYPGFEHLVDFMKEADFRFVNMESTIHKQECYTSQYGGGSWLCMHPNTLDDVREFGFNIMNLANNHSMDYSYEGLMKTLEYCEQANIPVAGTGATLFDAARPVYLDTLAGRFALIGAVSTFEAPAMAGEQTHSMPGRPGVNGLRFKEKYHVTPELLQIVRKLADETAINGYNDILRREGYMSPLRDDECALGSILFAEADETRRETSVNAVDMARIEKAIFEAQMQADCIVVSIHSHEIRHTSKEEPADFLVEFAHKCIDAGAHAVVGHGPHLLRPIEIYKGKPIFYSLGDFTLQNENIQRAPKEHFDMYGMSADSTMREMFTKRSNNFTRGLQTDSRMFETVAARWNMEDGVITSIDLLPLELGFGKARSTSGWPSPCFDKGIVERLAKMSESYGTAITIDDEGVGHITL